MTWGTFLILVLYEGQPSVTGGCLSQRTSNTGQYFCCLPEVLAVQFILCFVSWWILNPVVLSMGIWKKYSSHPKQPTLLSSSIRSDSSIQVKNRVLLTTLPKIYTTYGGPLYMWRPNRQSLYLHCNKMAAILQTILSDAFSWSKRFVFWLNFHWSLSLICQLTTVQHWFR